MKSYNYYYNISSAIPKASIDIALVEGSLIVKVPRGIVLRVGKLPIEGSLISSSLIYIVASLNFLISDRSLYLSIV